MGEIKNQKNHEYVDTMFQKHHTLSTLRTLSITIIFWIIVLFPFVFVAFRLLWLIRKGWMVITLVTLVLFFVGWGVILALISLFLVVYNNAQTMLQEYNSRMYNQEALSKKEKIFHNYFKNHFGDDIHERDFYDVTPDQNLPLNIFMDMYKDQKVDKKDGN